jgi:hypothetical protein
MRAMVVFEDGRGVAFEESPKGLRQERGLSQEKVGKCLGLPQSHVSMMERKFGEYMRLLANSPKGKSLGNK